MNCGWGGCVFKFSWGGKCGVLIHMTFGCLNCQLVGEWPIGRWPMRVSMFGHVRGMGELLPVSIKVNMRAHVRVHAGL